VAKNNKPYSYEPDSIIMATYGVHEEHRVFGLFQVKEPFNLLDKYHEWSGTDDDEYTLTERFYTWLKTEGFITALQYNEVWTSVDLIG